MRHDKYRVIPIDLVFWGLVVAALGCILIGMLAACDKQAAPEPAKPLPMMAAAEQPRPPVPSIMDGLRFPDNAGPGIVAIEIEQTGPTTAESVSGKGSGFVAEGDKAATDIDTGAPEARLSAGGGSTGGTTRGTISAQITDNQRQIACIVIGALFAAGGLWQFSRGNKYGLWIAGLGGGLVAAGLMPAWFWPIVGVCAIAAGAALWWTSRGAANATKYQEAVRAVAAGIEDLPSEVRKMAKAKIASHASDEDTAAIRAVKRLDRLPSERPEGAS